MKSIKIYLAFGIFFLALAVQAHATFLNITTYFPNANYFNATMGTWTDASPYAPPNNTGTDFTDTNYNSTNVSDDNKASQAGSSSLEEFMRYFFNWTKVVPTGGTINWFNVTCEAAMNSGTRDHKHLWIYNYTGAGSWNMTVNGTQSTSDENLTMNISNNAINEFVSDGTYNASNIICFGSDSSSSDTIYEDLLQIQISFNDPRVCGGAYNPSGDKHWNITSNVICDGDNFTVGGFINITDTGNLTLLHGANITTASDVNVTGNLTMISGLLRGNNYLINSHGNLSVVNSTFSFNALLLNSGNASFSSNSNITGVTTSNTTSLIVNRGNMSLSSVKLNTSAAAAYLMLFNSTGNLTIISSVLNNIGSSSSNIGLFILNYGNVINSNISKVYRGISFRDILTPMQITGNRISDTMEIGINPNNSKFINISNNIINTTTSSETRKEGIYSDLTYWINDSFIQYNIIYGNPALPAVDLTPHKNMTVRNNIFYGGVTNGAGILTLINYAPAKDTRNNVSNNIIYDMSTTATGKGIYFDYDSNDTILNNSVVNATNHDAMYFSNCFNETFINNTFNTSAAYGVDIPSGSPNNVFINNTIKSTTTGLYMASDNNYVYNNNITGGDQAVYIHPLSDNNYFNKTNFTVTSTNSNITQAGGNNNTFLEGYMTLAATSRYLNQSSGLVNYINITNLNDDSLITVGATGVFRKYLYIDFYVNDSASDPLNGANVTIWNATENFYVWNLTNSSGYTNRQTLKEYNMTAAGVINSSNYTISGTLATYNDNNTWNEITRKKLVVITLGQGAQTLNRYVYDKSNAADYVSKKASASAAVYDKSTAADYVSDRGKISPAVYDKSNATDYNSTSIKAVKSVYDKSSAVDYTSKTASSSANVYDSSGAKDYVARDITETSSVIERSVYDSSAAVDYVDRNISATIQISVYDSAGAVDYVSREITMMGAILSVSLITPPELTITQINQNSTFWVNSSIQCLNADCGIVDSNVRENSTANNPDTLISITPGDVPFHVVDGTQPQSCGDMLQNAFCYLNWSVNSTNFVNSYWAVDVNATGASTSMFNSPDAWIYINATGTPPAPSVSMPDIVVCMDSRHRQICINIRTNTIFIYPRAVK